MKIVDDEQRARLRRAVYDAFVSTGRGPKTPALAQQLDLPLAQVRASLAALHEARELVVLSGEVQMAIPWSAQKTAYAVRFGDVHSYVNCAWDALGAAVQMGGATVEGRDPLRGDPWSFVVDEEQPDLDESVVLHFALPASSWWEDVGFT
jgi:hypothetical protein